MKRTDYIDRNSGIFYFEKTKKEILDNWNPLCKPPILVPLSQFNRQEQEDYAIDSKIVPVACTICGKEHTEYVQYCFNYVCAECR